MSLKSKLTIALFTTRIRDSLLLKLLIAFLFVWTLLYMARDGLSERNHAQIIANAQLVQLERKFGAQIDSDRTMKCKFRM